MTRYKEVSLKSNNWSKEDIEYLVDQTFALMTKKRITLKGQSELQMVMDCLREARTIYGNSQESEPINPSESLKALDRQRDFDFTDLRYGLRAQLRSRQTNRREAAMVLYELTERYKESLSKPQVEQSASMKAFFKLMDTTENQAKLNLVGVLELYNHLKTSQEKFDAAYLKRVEGRSQRKQTNKDDARRHLIKTYRMVYRYLVCLEFFGKTTVHKELLNTFNDVRLSFKEMQARKAGQGKKKAKALEPLALLEEPIGALE